MFRELGVPALDASHDFPWRPVAKFPILELRFHLS
jgi:hypothetical protein